jgi:hypothetical protein
MNDDDVLLNQALSQLSEASDIAANEEVEEVARVKKARAGVTERARQNGDCVGNLLSGLLDDSNAIVEAERAEKERKAREREEQARQEREAEEARKREEAEHKLQEEKRKLEEKEERRKQLLIEMEKKRKREAGEVDEEEEARKREEAEAEARRIAEEKAREEAEEAELNSANAALEEQLRAAKARKAAEEAEEARKAHNKRVAKILLAAAAVLAVASGLTYYFATKKAPDWYILSEDYQSHALTMSLVVEESDVKPTIEFAYAEVKQEADKVQKTGHSGPSKPRDQYGIGTAANVFGTGTIVK